MTLALTRERDLAPGALGLHRTLTDEAYFGPGLTQVSGSDTASAADTGSLATAVATADTGTAVDAAALAIAAADTAAGANNATLATALPAADTASAAGNATLAASLTAADTASGADSASVNAGNNVNASDTATGANNATLAVAITATDLATAVDLAALAAARATADLATALDAATVDNGAGATITLTADFTELIATYGITHPRAFLIPAQPANTTGGVVRLGGAEATVTDTLTISEPGLPRGVYRLKVTYYSTVRGQRMTWTSPAFDLQADADLADLLP